MANHEARTGPTVEEMEDVWSGHSEAWRDPAQIVSHWRDTDKVDPSLLKYEVTGDWWNVLDSLEITLLVSREYEHLLLAVSHFDAPIVSYMPMPHPSGIAVDRNSATVYLASTRNPNQVFDLMPVNRCTKRLDAADCEIEDKPLVPVRSRFFPGCLYIHDLAFVEDNLYANAVGQNAVVRLNADGSYKRVWWPKCIETKDGPVFGQNFIQLNSIAVSTSIKDAYFSASSEKISSRRPGHKNYPVDKQGVIFSARTRQPVVRGLTRPHSARLESSTGSERLWVDNSGYGELGRVEDGKFISVTRLPGWTRGLAFCQKVAFVGTSRVIPKFSQYAPGLDVNASICAVHAVDIKSGKVLGSMIWPYGNQIFSIDWLPRRHSGGFPMRIASKSRDCKALFYTFSTKVQKD